MSLHACAGLVERGDPDRFRAVLAAPLDARKVLLPLYAFNVEVARAPWASQEPMIAEMRLQWWWDVLEEIVTDKQVRSHEVATPLSEVLDTDGAKLLQRNVDARRREAYREVLADADALQRYAAETAGSLMWVTTRALDRSRTWGPGDEERARSIGAAQGLANYLLAVPNFLARGFNPLPDMTDRAFRDLLGHNLKQWPRAGASAQRVAELAAWRARVILRRGLRDPAAVPGGRLDEPLILQRASLLWSSFRV